MRVFVAGATGAIGSRLVPLLVEAGHQVTGMTRSSHKTEQIRAAGATPVVADALDGEAVMRAVSAAAPEAIVHELTAIPDKLDIRNFDRVFALTNRLRTEGLDNLIAAGREAGCRRIVAQSYAGWVYAREGGPVKTEEDRLDPNPPAGIRSTFEAIRYLEETVAKLSGITGIALRYGGFYGPGNTLGAGGPCLKRFENGACRSSAAAPASGPSFISTTQRGQPYERSKQDLRGSTTLSMMNPLRYRSGSRRLRRRLARSRPSGYRRGSDG